MSAHRSAPLSEHDVSRVSGYLCVTSFHARYIKEDYGISDSKVSDLGPGGRGGTIISGTRGRTRSGTRDGTRSVTRNGTRGGTRGGTRSGTKSGTRGGTRTQEWDQR